MESFIELRDETEGEHVVTSDFFFDRVGEPVPVKRTEAGDDVSKLFDLEALPSQPLAVSQRFQLIFIAHSSEFCVARTGDVMEASKEMMDKGKGPSIMELSIVNISVGEVRILSLSPDSSILAASVGRDIHFFSVESLLSKGQKPLSSCSVEESSFVRDIRWLERKENAYILLSNHGKLYNGNVGGPPKSAMDEVDAFDVRGSFVAVAKGNNLIVLSSTLKEKLRILLTSTSWTNASDEDSSVKVDSVKWMRPDCIVLGCFQLNSDGKEENYFMQVVRSRTGRIDRANDASQMVVHSFYDVFAGMIDDILPSGNGPYLFFGYLNQCELGFAANRKNTDQHVVLFSWSLGEEQDDAVVVEIERNKWLPRIELQESGDDNLILGLCVDEVSVRDKVRVQLGVEEERELPTYCVLFCLTLEGKLSMFQVATLAESTGSPASIAQLSDEEEDMPAVVSQERSVSSISVGLPADILQNGPDFHKDGQNKEVTHKIAVDTDLKPPEIKVSPPYTIMGARAEQKLEIFGKGEAKMSTHLDANEVKGQPNLFGVNQFGGTSFQGGAMSGLPSGLFNQTSKFSFSGESISNFQISPSQNRESEGVVPSANFGSRFTFHSSDTEGKRSESNAFSVPTGNVPGTMFGEHAYANEVTAPSPLVNSSSVLQQKGQRASRDLGQIESIPSVRSSQLSFQETASGLTSTNHFVTFSEDKKKGPSPGMLKTEPSISKQFGNIKEMVKELDMLLESIEGKDGFKDACITAQKNPVEALENGIDSLSDQCTMWKGIMDERLEEVQQILDKSVQVLARQTYIEGIVKQASDDRYWELWNRQRLSTELELKRCHTAKLNQDLTNQLVLLERHFNTLELEKFSDGTGGPRNRQAYQKRFGPSRSVQSVHALHNTTCSQLAAAEQLSDCLSRQMEVLSIDSPPVRPRSVKKELFDVIGLPYDDSFSSPVGTKVSGTPSAKKLLLSSNSTATKDQSRRKQSSALKPSEPETARRRRDSLGQGWTSFEPPKTTVKRMQLQESRKVSTSKSPLMLEEQYLSSFEKTTAARKNRTTPSTFSYQQSKDSKQESSKSKLFQSPSLSFSPVNESPGSGATPAHQRTNLSITSSFGSPLTEQGKPSGASNLSALTPIIKATTEKPFTLPAKEANRWFQSPLETTPIEKKAVEVSSLTGKETGIAKSPLELVKQGKKLTESSPFATSKSDTEKVPQFGFGLAKSSAGEAISASTGVQVDSSKSLWMMSSSSSQQSSSSSVSLVKASTSSELSAVGSWNVSKASTDVNESPFAKFAPSPSLSSGNSLFSSSTPALFTTSSVASSSLFAPSSSSPSLSSASPELLAKSSSLTAPVGSASKSQKPEEESNQVKVSLEPDVTASQVAVPLTTEPLPSKPSSQLGLSLAPTPAGDISSGLASRTEASTNNGSSPASSIVASSIKQEGPSTTLPLFPTPTLTNGSATSQKVETAVVADSEEDEMEEEAPETNNNTPSLNLGSLSAFGLGSSTPATAKGNPFGSVSTTTTPSPFVSTIPSGELFRPASFSFQSPQTSQPSQPQTSSLFSGGFRAPAPTSQAPPSQGGFGQPAQIGGGQQALGSVLGSFGQSRQIGMGLPGVGVASSGGFTGGFGGAASTGFSSAATSGGFAGIASAGSGFGALASSGGGFGASAAGGGGFAGAASTGGGFGNVGSGGAGFGGVASTGGGFGGFAAAAPTGGGFAAAGGGFGAFGGQQAASGFSGFGSTGGNTSKPPELFTQMRK